MSNVIRVSLWVPIWCTGGVERYHLAAIEACRQFGDRARWVALCVDQAANVHPERIREAAEYVRIFRDPSHLPDLCDVIVVWAINDISSLAPFVERGGRVVVIQHGDNTWSRIWMLATLKSARAFLDKVTLVAVGNTAAECCRQVEGGFPVVIKGGIDLNRISPSRSREEIRQSMGLGPDQFAVGFVGRFSSEKNPGMVAKIVGKLGGAYTAVYHGHAMGDDAAMRQQVFRDSGGRAVIWGRDMPTGDVFAAIDCLVMASPQEAGPLVVVEAWLAGVPVVSTPVGLVQEYPAWVAHVAKHDDVDAFADAVKNIRTAMQRSDYPSHIATIAKRAASEFSLPAFAARWEKFIVELVGEQRVNTDQRLSESGVRAADPAACQDGDYHLGGQGKGSAELGAEGTDLSEAAA
ncbi:MAG: glycosyltransferase family 4 protein [Schlesneria sp.]